MHPRTQAIMRGLRAVPTTRTAALLAALAAVAATAGEVRAQWTFVDLHPTNSNFSIPRGASGNQQVGIARIGNSFGAARWTGSAGSAVSLNPVGATNSTANAACGNQQGGFARIGIANRAGIWTGTAASFVSLHPAGSVASEVMAMSANQQGGYSSFESTDERAGMWTGTAASWVDLTPNLPPAPFPGSAFVTGCRVLAVSEGENGELPQQGGYVTQGQFFYASLWTGSAASWVNLNPPESPTQGIVSGMWHTDGAGGPGQQVGEVVINNLPRASLWTGTAASWIDLHPAGASDSYCDAVMDGMQVGTARVNNIVRASLWTGSAASWVDLSQFLPPGAYSGSQATGIARDATTIYVVGFGGNIATGQNQAMLWTRPIAPPCPADYNQDGGVTGDDVAAFFADYEAGNASADTNQDGGITGDDVSAFFIAYEAGGC